MFAAWSSGLMSCLASNSCADDGPAKLSFSLPINLTHYWGVQGKKFKAGLRVNAVTAPMVASSGSKPLGQAHTNSKGSRAASRTQECTMLLPSPTYTTCMDVPLRVRCMIFVTEEH